MYVKSEDGGQKSEDRVQRAEGRSMKEEDASYRIVVGVGRDRPLTAFEDAIVSEARK